MCLRKKPNYSNGVTAREWLKEISEEEVNNMWMAIANMNFEKIERGNRCGDMS